MFFNTSFSCFNVNFTRKCYDVPKREVLKKITEKKKKEPFPKRKITNFLNNSYYYRSIKYKHNQTTLSEIH